MSPFIFKIPGVLLYLEKQGLTASDKAVSDKFGWDVAIDGNIAVVGAAFADTNGLSDSGAAYIFEKSGGTWTEVQKITASDKAVSDKFGRSVAISGDIIVIGASEAASASVSNSGAAYIFEKVVTWPATETIKIEASANIPGMSFGFSVGISGNVVVIGAQGATPSGAAYVFEKATTWPTTETQKITASDEGSEISSANFGREVAISGTTILIGAWLADVAGASNAGAGYVYEKSGTWLEVQKLTASDFAATDYFGYSIAIDGTNIVIGARGADPTGLSSAGAAYIYEKAGTWPATETLKITASDKQAGDQFGTSVGISANTIIVGASIKVVNGVAGAGGAYIFEKAVVWPATETQIIEVSAPSINDYTGAAVSISGTEAFISSAYNDPSGLVDAGLTYVFAK